MPEFVLSHSGVKGMHWGVRRFRNYDGSLTAAGKKRYDYDEEGERSVRRAMQDQRKRERALSKLSTVNRRYPDYTEKELDTAVKKRAYRDTINAMARLESQRKLEARNERQAAKMQAKLEKAQYKAKIADEKANLKKAKMKLEQDQIRFENEEKRKQVKGEQELQASIEAAKADRWKHRVTKVTSILSIAKMGKTITDQLGLTNPEDGSSWFNVVGKSMGWNTAKASDVTSSNSGSGKDNKQPKDNSSSGKNNKQPKDNSSSDKDSKQTQPKSTPAASSPESSSPKYQGELTAPEPKENKERKILKSPTVSQNGGGRRGVPWITKEEQTPKVESNGQTENKGFYPPALLQSKPSNTGGGGRRGVPWITKEESKPKVESNGQTENKGFYPPALLQSRPTNNREVPWITKEESKPKENQNSASPIGEKAAIDSGLKFKVPESIERIGKENIRYIRDTPLSEIIDKRETRGSKILGGKSSYDEFVRKNGETPVDSLKEYIPFWQISKKVTPRART